MRITQVTAFKVQPRWVFVKVETDEGIVGWGEPSLEGQPNAVVGAIEDIKPRLIGADPIQIERLWQTVYRGHFYRGGAVTMSALSGVEQACWDIAGKAQGVPVYRLLGGGGACRDRIRAYRHVGGATTEALVENAQKVVADEGLTCIKYNPVGPALYGLAGADFAREAAERVGALREALPGSVDIALDIHGRLSAAAALPVLAALEPHSPFFVEEPVLPEHTASLARLSRQTRLPLATGERLIGKWAFREVIEAEAVAVVQPDLSHCGGILEGRKIAAMAEAHGIFVAPHNPLGPLCTAAAMHLAAATPNFLVQEIVVGCRPGDPACGADPSIFAIRDGYLALPDGPGLGVTVDEEWVRAHPFETWTNPLYDTPDGFVTEW